MSNIKVGLKTTLIGVLINSVLAAIKIITGIVGNSYALIADGIESTTDIVSSMIVWSGLKIASRPADPSHPYGHGKAESLAALAVSIALLAAAVSIVIQSIREIQTSHTMPAPYTLYVLIGVVIIKETLFRIVEKKGDEVNSTAMKADAFHHRSDALTSLAAFFGISIALIGGDGYESADDWAALLASGIIAYNGINMMRFSLTEIMDTSIPSLDDKVRELAKQTEGVVDIEKCYIRKNGFNYIVDIHVIVAGTLTVTKGHEIGHKVKDNLQSSSLKISNVMVHVEPDE